MYACVHMWLCVDVMRACAKARTYFRPANSIFVGFTRAGGGGGWICGSHLASADINNTYQNKEEN